MRTATRQTISALVAVGLLLLAPGQGAGEETGHALLVKVTAEGSAAAKAAALVFQARLASLGSIGVLEGLDGGALAQEVALSEAGLVDSGSLVKDAALAPDVTLTFTDGAGPPGTRFEGTVSLVGAAGEARAIPIQSGEGFSLSAPDRAALLVALGEVLPRAKRAAWSGTCLGETPDLDALTDGRCAAAMDVLCRGAGTAPFGEVGCIALFAKDMMKSRKRLSGALDRYRSLTPAEAAVFARLQAKDKSLKKDAAAQGALTDLSVKAMKLDQEIKGALEAFQAEILSVLGRRLATPAVVSPGFGTDDEAFSMTGLTLTGFRFKKGDQGPKAVLDLAFAASTPREERDLGGQVVPFDQVLRSFNMEGIGAKGEVLYTYHLLVSKDRQNGGVIQTSVPLERLEATASYRIVKVARKGVRVE